MITDPVAVQAAEAARLAYRDLITRNAIHEAGHCLCALEAGAQVLSVNVSPEGGHTEADLAALDLIDQAAFDIAGALAEVITGIGNPALEALDLPGLGSDGVWFAFMLGRSGASCTAVLERADNLLTATPGALVALAELLASAGFLSAEQIAYWWEQCESVGIDSPYGAPADSYRPLSAARMWPAICPGQGVLR